MQKGFSLHWEGIFPTLAKERGSRQRKRKTGGNEINTAKQRYVLDIQAFLGALQVR